MSEQAIDMYDKIFSRVADITIALAAILIILSVVFEFIELKKSLKDHPVNQDLATISTITTRDDNNNNNNNNNNNSNNGNEV